MQRLVVLDQERRVSLIRACPWRVMDKLEQLLERPAAGLSALGQYEGVILYIFQGCALLTLAGLALSVRRHRDYAPLIVGALGCANLAYHFYWEFSLPALYGGLLGLIAATIWNYLSTRRGKQPILQSTTTCPHCSHKSDERCRPTPVFSFMIALVVELA
jgi:hypothetical protein